MTDPTNNPTLLEQMARAIWLLDFPKSDGDWPEFLAWYRAGEGDPKSVVHHSTIAKALRAAKAALQPLLGDLPEEVIEAGVTCSHAYAGAEAQISRSPRNTSNTFHAMIQTILDQEKA